MRRISELRAEDLGQVGGKAAGLWRMMQIGLPVPDAWVVAEGEPIGPVPDGRYAVRSSANVEDGADHSFAGVFHTTLNVPAEEVAQAVAACCARARAKEVADYLDRQGIAGPVEMAVVIQPMIRAERAGVMFTCDPVRNDDSLVVIESIAGLGHTLVDGTATPARHIVTKTGGLVLAGGAEISDGDLQALVHMGLRVEATLGRPADVEWVLAEGQIHLLQARPVTRFQPKPPAPDRFDKAITRNWTLMFCEQCHIALTDTIKAQLGWAFSDLIYVSKGDRVVSYRPPQEFTLDFPRLAALGLAEDPDWITTQAAIYDDLLARARGLAAALTPEAMRKMTRAELGAAWTSFLQAGCAALPRYTLLVWFPHWVAQNGYDRLRGAAQPLVDTRTACHEFGSEADRCLRAVGAEILRRCGNAEAGLDRVVSINDALRFFSLGLAPDLGTLRDRAHRFVLSKSGVTTETRRAFAARTGRILVKPKPLRGDLRGDVAFPGRVKAPVRVIRGHGDFQGFTPGEILVAANVTPDFEPILAKAAAMITDEGGITSHVAILARERELPCIMATGHATKILKTGDVVALDHGEIRVLTRAK